MQLLEVYVCTSVASLRMNFLGYWLRPVDQKRNGKKPRMQMKQTRNQLKDLSGPRTTPYHDGCHNLIHSLLSVPSSYVILHIILPSSAMSADGTH
jgi:hypothetical protein